MLGLSHESQAQPAFLTMASQGEKTHLSKRRATFLDDGTPMECGSGGSGPKRKRLSRGNREADAAAVDAACDGGRNEGTVLDWSRASAAVLSLISKHAVTSVATTTASPAQPPALALANKRWRAAVLGEGWRIASLERIARLVDLKARALNLTKLTVWIHRAQFVKRVLFEHDSATNSSIAQCIAALGSLLLLGATTNLDTIHVNTANNPSQATLDLAAIALLGSTAPPSLTTLVLRSKHVTDAALAAITLGYSSTVTILKLTVSGSSPISDTGLITALSQLPNLTSFQIKGCSSNAISASLMHHLATRHPKLTELFLFPKGGLDPSAFCMTLTVDEILFATLKVLVLDANPKTNDNLSHSRTLQRRSISILSDTQYTQHSSPAHNTPVHDCSPHPTWTHGLTTLLSHLPRHPPMLHHFALSGDALVNLSLFYLLTGTLAPSLRRLHLGAFAPGIDARMFVDALRGCVYLEDVRVAFENGCGGRVGPGMGVALAKGCKSLRWLEISGGGLEGLGEAVMEVYHEVRREFC
ncbi:hypothetical protein BC830DRAFT_1149235 [Chytriomyces sp. MP71]|nr:hypothetical protein BC830DRAFT_1149235 [Chytriomyces sp. MP71]